MLQRHRVSDGKVEWTVDHGLAFFPGFDIRKAVVVAGDPLRVVLSVDSSIYAQFNSNIRLKWARLTSGLVVHVLFVIHVSSIKT